MAQITNAYTILTVPKVNELVIASCLYRRGRYCARTMNREEVVGWIKRGIKTNAATRSGSTVATNGRRWFLLGWWIRFA